MTGTPHSHTASAVSGATKIKWSERSLQLWVLNPIQKKNRWLKGMSVNIPMCLGVPGKLTTIILRPWETVLDDRALNGIRNKGMPLEALAPLSHQRWISLQPLLEKMIVYPNFLLKILRHVNQRPKRSNFHSLKNGGGKESVTGLTTFSKHGKGQRMLTVKAIELKWFF